MDDYIINFSNLMEEFNEDNGSVKQCYQDFGKELWSFHIGSKSETDTDEEYDIGELLLGFIRGDTSFMVGNNDEARRSKNVEKVLAAFKKLKECESTFVNQKEVVPWDVPLYRGINLNIEQLQELDWKRHSLPKLKEATDNSSMSGAWVPLAVDYKYEARTPIQSWTSDAEVSLAFSSMVSNKELLDDIEMIIKENENENIKDPSSISDETIERIRRTWGGEVDLLLKKPGGILYWEEPDRDQLFLNPDTMNVFSTSNMGPEYETIRISNEPINVKLITMSDYLINLINLYPILKRVQEHG